MQGLLAGDNVPLPVFVEYVAHHHQQPETSPSLSPSSLLPPGQHRTVQRQASILESIDSNEPGELSVSSDSESQKTHRLHSPSTRPDAGDEVPSHDNPPVIKSNQSDLLARFQQCTDQLVLL